MLKRQSLRTPRDTSEGPGGSNGKGGGKGRPRPSAKPRAAFPAPSAGPFGCGVFALVTLKESGPPWSFRSRFSAVDTGGGAGTASALDATPAAGCADGGARVGFEGVHVAGPFEGTPCGRRARPANAV